MYQTPISPPRCPRSLLMALVAALAGLAPAWGSSPGPLQIPEDAWSVRYVPAPTYGQPLLRIDITSDFEWPRPAEGDVEYRVDLTLPGERQLVDVGRLTAEERFAIVLVWPDRLRGELEGGSEEPVQGTPGVFPEPETGEEVLAAFDRLREQLPSRLPAQELAERLEVGLTEVSLVPVVGGRAVLRQETPWRRPRARRYVWNRPVWPILWIGPDEPLEVPPEDLVEAKIKRLRDRLCSLRNPDGSPRYRDLCGRLNEMLGPGGRRFHIECRIPAQRGMTAGFTDMRGDVTLDGEYMMEGDCAIATVIHELAHQQDIDAGLMENVRRLAEAESEARDADRQGRQALEDGDLQEAFRQLDKLRSAQARIELVEQQAGREQIASECNALFAVIGAADLFGYPGPGLAWMKETIVDMVGELSSLRHMFELPMVDPQGPLCLCFRRIDAWVAAHADVNANFDRQTFGNTGATVNRVIDVLTARYCGN